jgi:hypothetical protein
MIHLTLFDPVTVDMAILFAPYALEPGRTFLTYGKGEIGFTFYGVTDLLIFQRRLNDTINQVLEDECSRED